MENIVRVLQGVQYDGTNSSAVLDLYPPIQGFNNSYYEAYITSEVDGVLTVHYDDQGAGLETPYDKEISIGDWVLPGLNVPCDVYADSGIARLSTLVNP